MKRKRCPICGGNVRGRVYASILYSGMYEAGTLQADGWIGHQKGKRHQEALKSLPAKEKAERKELLARMGWGNTRKRRQRGMLMGTSENGEG